jgi:hypothetical protein
MRNVIYDTLQSLLPCKEICRDGTQFSKFHFHFCPQTVYDVGARLTFIGQKIKE